MRKYSDLEASAGRPIEPHVMQFLEYKARALLLMSRSMLKLQNQGVQYLAAKGNTSIFRRPPPCSRSTSPAAWHILLFEFPAQVPGLPSESRDT